MGGDLRGGMESIKLVQLVEAILLFQEIVKALNYRRHVRVYVFSFRKNEGLYSDRLQGLACTNRGYYSKILYFGQIESALQRLVQVRGALK